MTTKTITIVQLYPREMNIYGDWGNVLTLKKRLEWHGYGVELLPHHPGAAFPDRADLLVGGGGQDSGQTKVVDDLQKIGGQLHKLADDGAPMLMVCGLYQLFGRFFQTSDGAKLPGIALFKAETIAGPERLIGNVILDSQFGEIIGYENHSGLTYLDADQSALGRVLKGKGNNGQNKLEGAVYKNVIGSYLHGSLLPKNPALADHLIAQAVIRKYGRFEPQAIDDPFVFQARKIAKRRTR